jgi:hypothetical protein
MQKPPAAPTHLGKLLARSAARSLYLAACLEFRQTYFVRQLPSSANLARISETVSGIGWSSEMSRSSRAANHALPL